MKVVILAGGHGTRFREETDVKPKPMIEVGNMPILTHLIKYFINFGHTEFIICGGYKANYIKEYFANFELHTSDVVFEFGNSQKTSFLNSQIPKFKISVFDTGLDSKTAERILRIKDALGGEPFLCTYGDGLIDLDLNNLVRFHDSNNKIATVTAVKPRGRFGVLDLNENLVASFDEKPISDFWINAGFFVFENKIFDYLEGGQMLEEEPLRKLVQNSELNAFKHEGFWQPMDTYRDWIILNDLWKSSAAPWKVW
jgi:glucose-1-phosphate cytidylyltransferase